MQISIEQVVWVGFGIDAEGPGNKQVGIYRMGETLLLFIEWVIDVKLDLQL